MSGLNASSKPGRSKSIWQPHERVAEWQTQQGAGSDRPCLCPIAGSAGSSPVALNNSGTSLNMKWYYTIAGGHTHVRVFMTGAKCGDLCFRNEEFQELMEVIAKRGPFLIQFIDETPKDL